MKRMNEASRQRLELVRPLVPRWSLDPRVKAVAVGGSVATGLADRYSDIDLYVFWDSLPETSGAAKNLEEHEAWIDQLKVGTVPVEVSHFTRERLDEIFDKVLVRCDPDPAKQDLVNAVQTALPLYDSGFLSAYVARAECYPDDLARNVVRQHLQFTPRWYIRTLAERDDVIRLHDLLGHDLRNLIAVLLGLNRLYHPHPKFKSYELMVRRMRIAPSDLLARCRRTLCSAPAKSARCLEELVTDLFLLVRSEMPDIDLVPCVAHYEAPGQDSELPLR
jgi:predicted nucleotidyltransferase